MVKEPKEGKLIRKKVVFPVDERSVSATYEVDGGRTPNGGSGTWC